MEQPGWKCIPQSKNRGISKFRSYTFNHDTGNLFVAHFTGTQIYFLQTILYSPFPSSTTIIAEIHIFNKHWNQAAHTSVSFTPGLILDTVAAVGDIVVICSSVSTDDVPSGPGQKKERTHHRSLFPRKTLLVGLFQSQDWVSVMDLFWCSDCKTVKKNKPLSLELDSRSLALSSSFSRLWILSFSSATVLSVAPLLSCNFSSRTLLAKGEKKGHR